MKIIRSLWEAITFPFVSIAVLIDESKRINEDGSLNEYNRKRNEKMMRKEERKH
jgi:lysophospholipid acyltransferase (LPLAT)-like uncharacterized protein